MSKSTDMNGIWSGMYNYDHFDQTVKFTAWLDDVLGALGGTTMEPNTFLEDGPDELVADIKGARTGLDLAFYKVYAHERQAPLDPVKYEGEANNAFTEVRGVWRFDRPDAPSGQFRLVRMVEGLASRKAWTRSEAVEP
ncbi:MAG: hypothetical protein AAGJ50_00525 [Pseudomonadota bacterium]